jgi:ABC-type Fe3+ transport system substrate-binding protein
MRKAASLLIVVGLLVALLGAGMLSGCAGEEEVEEPTLTTVNPGSAKLGETLDVAITGTNLTEAVAVNFGSGITVSSFTADSATNITASIAIAAGATVGSRNVSVTCPSGTATKSGGFSVTSLTAPSVSGISPNSGEQAETLAVTITGTNFVDVTDVSLGSKITVNSFTVASETQIIANITIALNAIEDMRDVSVTNSGGTGIGGGIFTVTWPAALDELIAAAVAEGTLNYMGSLHEPTMDALEQGLNEKYGINININSSSGPSMPRMAAQIIQEYQAGATAMTDLYWGSGSHMPLLYQADALKVFDWNEYFPHIPDDCIQLTGTSIEAASALRGISYNTERIAPDEVPKTTADLLGKGWAIASTPYASGWYELSEPYAWGHEATVAFVTQLAEEVTGLIRNSETERVGSGEFDLFVLDGGDHDAWMAANDGAPIAWSFLEDATVVQFNYFGVPKNSEHPNLAALVAGYTMSLEGQQIFYETNHKSSHRVEGTEVYSNFLEWAGQGIEFIEPTTDVLATHLDLHVQWKSELVNILTGAV